ncbi:hypothetical protein SAMN04490244_102408 [Tranquillimonas rosea]|uniref:Uncharacterized protein n=1 Tax=Tranquillimonas rosea TaxID=641238 RepID=A0A1H9RQN4_9RHOB|nr:hypothetical protein [Tranquillimonas rosea]SER75016.1 hypothetical protein SAMN04490244_102408 [Tranquillimonas rosea]
MKAFVTAAGIVAVGAVLTYFALGAFAQPTALRYGDESVILLDHDIGMGGGH